MIALLVLGIETSCDETAAAVVEDGRRVRSDVVASQILVHAEFGGVVPEVASRQHVATIVPVVRRAMAEAGVAWGELDGIAVTNGPGLVGALLVGVETAKAMGYGLGCPVVGVNHLAGHLAAVFLEDPAIPRPPPYPHLALLVSGGHTALIRVDGSGRFTSWEQRATTRPARHSTRSGKCWVWATRVGCRSISCRRRETATRLRCRAPTRSRRHRF